MSYCLGLHPVGRRKLGLVVPFLESCNLTISFGMSGHLLSCSLSSCQNLVVVNSSGVKFADLLIESLDLVKICRLAEAFTCSLLSSYQPWSELLDSSSVLSPELDIVGVFVTLNLCGSGQVSDILGDSGKLILPGLGIGRDGVSLGKNCLFSGSIGLQDLNLGGNVFLEIHGSGNSVLREHAARGCLDVLKLSSSS